MTKPKASSACLSALLLFLLPACGRKPHPTAQAAIPTPTTAGALPPAATPPTTAPAPQLKSLSGVDATRLDIVRSVGVADIDAAEFPLVTRFQDPRMIVKVASPDGKWLAWRGQDKQAYWLFLSDAAGKHVRRLSACRNAYQPVWSPDSRRILYSAMDWKRRERNLCVYSLKRGKRLLTAFNSRMRLGALAAWSPDGSKIVFSYYGNLWIMNSNGIGRELLDLKRHIGRPVGEAQRIAWSRDGRQLAYQMRGDDTVYILDLAAR